MKNFQEMKILARYGRPCGEAFNKDDFLKKHPQCNWQKNYLWDRPSRDYAQFSSYLR